MTSYIEYQGGPDELMLTQRQIAKIQKSLEIQTLIIIFTLLYYMKE